MYFPRLHPDELLYSGIARCRVHLGMENHKGLLHLLFNDNKVAAITDLPTHLDGLASNTGLDAHHVIYHHTLFPLYAPFIPQQRRVNLYKAMLAKDRPTIGLAGISTAVVKWPEWLRYCPECLVQMVEDYGEPYWRRSWQIKGNEACPEHRCRLLDSPVPYRRNHRHEFHPATIDLLQHDHRRLPVRNIDVQLAHAFEQLLANPGNRSPGHGRWTNFYKHLATELDALRGQQVRSDLLWERVLKVFGNTYLRENGLIDEGAETPHWFTSIFRKHRHAFAPLQHLILWASLRPDQGVETIVQEANTRQAYKQGNKPQVLLPAEPGLTKGYRARWRQSLARYGDTKTARNHEGGCYAWLYRHDHDWLQQTNAYKKAKYGNNRHTDWEQRDRPLVRMLIRIDRTTIENLEQPRRSRNWYLSHLPHRASVEHNLHRLPLCREFLAGHAESRGEYQIRRITREMVKDVQLGIKPRPWELKRCSGLEDNKLQPMTFRFLQSIGEWLD